MIAGPMIICISVVSVKQLFDEICFLGIYCQDIPRYTNKKNAKTLSQNHKSWFNFLAQNFRDQVNI